MGQKFGVITIIVLVIVTITSLTGLAQRDDIITITPQSGPVGTVFDIYATDLTPDHEYVIDFVYAETDTVVFTTRRTTNSDGTLILPITSEEGDEPGLYYAQIVDTGTIVAQGEFTITEAGDSGSSSDDSLRSAGENQTTNTDNISISPRSAVIGAIHKIIIRQLEPEQTVTIDITLNDTEEIVYSKTWTADTAGRIELEIFAEDEDDAGLHVVTATDSRGNIVARGEFIIEGKPERNTQIAIHPESGGTDINREISLTGLIPFEDVRLKVIHAENGEIIHSVTKRADVDGNLTFEIARTIELEASEYEIVVEAIEEDNQTILVSSMIVSEDASSIAKESTEIEITITPSSGPIGTDHIIEVSGLEPDETITLDFMYKGESVFKADRTADEDGRASITITSEESDEAGEYTVHVARDGAMIASSNFSIEEDIASGDEDDAVSVPPSDSDNSVSVSITPPSGPIGTNHVVEVSGLEPDETITIDFLHNGESVYAAQRDANESGIASITIASEEGDEFGEYQVQIIRDDTVIADAAFTVSEEAIAEGPESTEDERSQPETAPDSDVEVTISPPSGLIGTLHRITATGLEPDETVTFDILFDGESIFSARRAANEEGVATLDINSEEGDAEGLYTITVKRDNEIVASARLEIGAEIAGDEDETAESPGASGPAVGLDENATLAISPESGIRGTTHTIEITGLEPDETVDVNITYGEDAMVYSTRRTADANGNIEFNIVTEEQDDPGSYQVDVIRDNATIIARGSINIESGEPLSAVNATVSPEMGEIGTSHEITITGLKPNERITVELMLGTRIVYATQRAADDDGIVRLAIVSEEDDTPGSYNVIIKRDSEVIENAAELIILADDGTMPEIAAGPGELITYGEIATTNFNIETTMQTFSFQAKEGEIIDIVVDSNNDIDTFMTLFGPDNSRLAFDDDSGSGFDPEIRKFIAEDPGTYTIQLEPYTPGDSGSVTLEVNSAVMLMEIESTMQFTLNDKQSIEALVFEAQSGETILFTLDVISGNAEDLQIVATQNRNELMHYSTTGIGGSSITLGFVAPEDGQIIIRVDNIGLTNIALEVELK